MRIYEINTIKPIKPLTPAQLRIRSLKQNVDRARQAVKTERERQKSQSELEQQRRQAQQRLRTGE
jgi:hypothetical protein